MNCVGYELTLWNRVLPEKLIQSNPPSFIESEVPLPNSHYPGLGLYLNSFYTLTTCFFNISFMTSHLTPRSSNSFFSCLLLTVFCVFLISSFLHSSYTPWFYHHNNVWWRVEVRRSSLCSLLHHPVTYSLSWVQIFYPTLYSQTPVLLM